MVGYGREGKVRTILAVFNFHCQYWLWCPIFRSLIGDVVACFIYDSLLYVSNDSFINKPCNKP